jgi:hypothetical protein
MCLIVQKLGGGVIGSVLIVAEHHIQHPVQAVLVAQWLRTIGPSMHAIRAREVR